MLKIPKHFRHNNLFISKMFGYHDWGVSVEFFQFIDSINGPYSVDIFADSYNKQILILYSMFIRCRCLFHWLEGGQQFVVPLIILVCRVINNCFAFKESGTFIITNGSLCHFGICYFNIICYTNLTCLRWWNSGYWRHLYSFIFMLLKRNLCWFKIKNNKICIICNLFYYN